MAKKVIKVVYCCFLCKNVVRDKDAFETKYVADIQYNPGSAPVTQESKVTLCRECLIKAGYLSRKTIKKPKEDKRQIKMFKKDTVKDVPQNTPQPTQTAI